MTDFLKWISNIASVLAIVTFIYVLWIERKLESFKNKVLFNTRVEHLVKDLIKANSYLSKQQEDIVGQRKDLKNTFWKIDSILSDIKPKLPKELHSDIDEIQSSFYSTKKVKFFDGKKPKKEVWDYFWVYFNKKDLEDLYIAIDVLSGRIENSMKDSEIVS